MRLLSDFFQLVACQATDAAFSATLRTVPDHPIYRSHFPKHPVTPGVLLVQLVCELSSQVWGQSLTIGCVKNVKYLNQLNPVETPTFSVSVSRTEDAGGVKLSAQVFDGERLFAKVSLLCISPLER